MAIIKELSSHLADLIAAGEVVERPASVAKELVENAIDAGSNRITVEIENGGITYLRIADNGCGMAPEFLAHVFEPFAREHDSRTESVEGTGLGLSIAKELTQRMGGSIGAALHGGTLTVWVEFPRQETG